MTFVNYSSNISFNKIELLSKAPDGKVIPIAYAHIFSNAIDYNSSVFDSITIDDLPEAKLGDIFIKIANLRQNDSRLSFYFPESNREARYIDPGKWLIMAVNFEGLFETVYPGFKSKQNPQFAKVKNLALKRIDNDSDNEQLSKKEKKYFKKCREQIEKYDGRLEEQFKYIYDKYKDILSHIVDSNKYDFNIDPSEDLSSIYADYRNKLAHGDIAPLSNKEIAVYKLLQPMIYIMLLDSVNLKKEELQKIIIKIFK